MSLFDQLKKAAQGHIARTGSQDPRTSSQAPRTDAAPASAAKAAAPEDSDPTPDKAQACPPPIETSEVTACDTPEKYLPMKDILVPAVVAFLRQLCALEEEIYQRSEKMEADKLRAGIPKSQMAPGSMELWEEYRERYGEIAKLHCTQKLLDRGYGRSYGCPATYAYLNTGCKLDFTMKSPKKAVIVTHYHKGIDMKHQFVLKIEENEWNIDSVSYGYENESTWHVDSI